jgi:hypothetical protein
VLRLLLLVLVLVLLLLLLLLPLLLLRTTHFQRGRGGAAGGGSGGGGGGGGGGSVVMHTDGVLPCIIVPRIILAIIFTVRHGCAERAKPLWQGISSGQIGFQRRDTAVMMSEIVGRRVGDEGLCWCW